MICNVLIQIRTKLGLIHLNVIELLLFGLGKTQSNIFPKQSATEKKVIGFREWRQVELAKVESLLDRVLDKREDISTAGHIARKPPTSVMFEKIK